MIAPYAGVSRELLVGDGDHQFPLLCSRMTLPPGEFDFDFEGGLFLGGGGGKISGGADLVLLLGLHIPTPASVVGSICSHERADGWTGGQGGWPSQGLPKRIIFWNAN